MIVLRVERFCGFAGLGSTGQAVERVGSRLTV